MLKEYDLPKIKLLDGETWPAHFHDEVEVMLVLKGSGRACYNGTYHNQPAGSVLFVPPRMIHSYDNRTEDFVGIGLFMEMNRIKELFPHPNALYPNDPIWFDAEMKHPIWSLSQAILATSNEVDVTSMSLLVCGIINEILKCFSFTKPLYQGTSLQKVLEYCQKHYKEPLTVSTLAAALSLSEGYISHLFSNRLHQSFPDYINALRANEATRMMKNLDISLSDVSTACGFSTTRTFNRAFLKQFGVSPRDYRKRIASTRSVTLED